MTQPTPPVPMLRTTEGREHLMQAIDHLAVVSRAELEAGNTQVGMMTNELVISLYRLALRFPDLPRRVRWEGDDQ